MKKLLSFLMFITFSVTSFSQTKSTTYTESGFSADFPKEPTIQKKNIESKVGKIDMTLYTCEAESFMIMISENKFPQELVTALDAPGIDGLLNGSKNGALNNVAKQMGAELKIISEEKYSYKNKFPALKAIAKLNDYAVTAIYIMKGNQMYQIILMGDTSKKEAIDFLNSFDVIE
ncbi:hypothetical protein [Flavobacterium sp.]|uniref:hypothetical protein n=1 Tax=Flavobacterium sp. TaxID=239 RepID=UPI00374D843B